MGNTTDILRVLHETTGVDFSGYRPQTAERRIRSRMTTLRIDELAEYERLLRDCSGEVQLLIERLTIKVSRFYRNPQVFDALRAELLPLLASRGRPVRVWSAGCGRGEEAYSLAMLLQEAGIAGEVLATDVDPLALLHLRQARYAPEALADVPAAWRARFFEPAQPGSQLHAVVDSVKRRVQVEHADLARGPGPQGAPFDLICCRNVLIYWNAAAQRAILEQLLLRLRPGGWLCLGEAEWLDPVAAGLDVVAAPLRLFRSASTERTA